MTSGKHLTVTLDPWSGLSQFTEARIALGRAGSSLPLAESLKFKLAHARARDAVHQSPNLVSLAHRLEAKGHTTLILESSVADRAEYLTRPDKGRRLSDRSLSLLAEQPKGYDLCIVISDGLSATAINENGYAVASGFLDALANTTLAAAPVCLVRNGRVAIGDNIAQALQCRMVVILIGERPGLSSPNSLGVYITHGPVEGITDEARNCISNIRQGGMSPEDAVKKIAYLVEAGFQLGTTGIELKDKMMSDYLPFSGCSLLLSS